MILGKLASMGVNVAKRAAKPAFNKAVSKFQQADAALVRKVNNKIMPKPTLTRDMSVSAKVKAFDAAADKSRNLAKTLVRSTYVAAPAYVAFEATGGARDVKPRKSPPTTPKTYDRKIGPAPSSTSPKKTVKNPVKKTTRPMASVPTVKNRRTPTTGPKTQVEVGSSIIRNRDGSIKKIKGPSAKGRAIVDAQQKLQKKSKYSRMTTGQINRLSPKEKKKYKQWKASQSK